MRKVFSFAVVLLTALSCQTEFKLPSFSISSFSPSEGYAGDEVVIVGQNFSLTTTDNVVRFGDVEAPVVTGTETQLRVKVPATAKTDFISVTINGQTLGFVDKFTVLTGKVTSIVPTSGRIGSYVILSGVGFDANTKVFFGTTEAPVISDGANTFVVAVPDLAGSEADVTAVIGGNTLNVFEGFQIIHDTWSERGVLPGASPRTNPVWFAIGSKLYYGLGYTGTGGDTQEQLDVWEYSTESDEWVQKNDFLEKPSGGAHHTLEQQTSFVVDNKAYVVAASELWEYDPALDKWTQKGPVEPAARDYPVSFVIDGKAYFGTGSGEPSYTDFWQYDPSTDEWSPKANFAGGGRTSAVGFAIGKRGFLGGGSTSDDRDFFQYDPEQDKWMLKTDCPTISEEAYRAQFSVGDYGYFGDANRKFYKYDPTPSLWIDMEIIPEPVSGDTNYWGVATGNKAYVRNNTQLWQMNLE